MHDILKLGGTALALSLIAHGAWAQLGDPSSGHSPALLARALGDVGPLEQAIAEDLSARLTEILGSDTYAGGFELRWDNAVCHAAAPLWLERPPVGVCFVLAVAVNVGATYAVTVPADGPASFVLLELVIE